MAYKPTGRPPGRPKNASRAFAWKVAKETRKERRENAPIFGPPKPKGLGSPGWGGRRAESGRKKKEGADRKKTVSVWLELDLATRLESLPPHNRSQYIREALDLFATISPPEQYTVKERKTEEIGITHSPLR